MSSNDSAHERWVTRRIDDVIYKIPLTGIKLNQRDYEKKGKFPVIDQGQNYIGGFTNLDMVVPCSLPVIVFGDHTKVIKYIDFPFVAGADGIIVIKPNDDFLPKLFFYFLQAIKLPNKGYARHFQYLEREYIPNPPLKEQEQIIGKIEELFSQLDAGVEGLKRVQAGLRRYRASVLKAAFEGSLVLQDPYDEPAIELLKKHGKEPIFLDNHQYLPKGWCYSQVRDLSIRIQYGTSIKANSSINGIPILRMANIQDGKLDFTHLKYLQSNLDQINGLILDDGDLLFNRTNSAELVGKTAVFRNVKLNFTFASYLIRVKFNSDLCISEYISFYINSISGREYINSVVSQQVGQANVNGKKLASMSLPLPPINEQKRIVAEIEKHFSIIERIEQTVLCNLRRATRLKQTILRQAFTGKLEITCQKL